MTIFVNINVRRGVQDFEPQLYMEKGIAKKRTTLQFALAAADVEDAALDLDKTDRKDWRYYWFGDRWPDTIEKQYKILLDKGPVG